MEVILLERVAKLGQMGDVVRVKDGFARNFLLPKGKALRATKDNRSRFENMKVDLEARNLEQKGEAEKVAAEARRPELHGAAPGRRRRPALRLGVAARSRRRWSARSGFAVSRAQIALNTPIKTIGLHKVPVSLHPEVEVTINVDVARNADEAERLARGEDVTVAARRSRRSRRSRRWPRRKPSSSPRWWRRAAARKPPQAAGETRKRNRRR